MSDNSISGARWKGIALVAAVVFAGMIAYSWLKAHDAWTRFQIEGQLKDQQIAARDRQAAAEREVIEQLKKQTQTPQQIVREIPKVIALPVPPEESGIRSRESDKVADSRPPAPLDRLGAGSDPLPSAPQPQASGIYFPAEDAKPLFDRLADCKAMESQLSACQQNFTDMKQERDLAVKARRGSFWQRAKQIGIAIAIGGAIGYAARR